jgi:uncharacterized repeat protein (TIGR01451 family)
MALENGGGIQFARSLWLALALVGAASVLGGGTLLAQGTAVVEAPVKVTLTAWLVTVDAAGKEVFAPAVTATPGDLIEYRVESLNTSVAPVSGQRLDLPIPAGTVFVEGSAKPGGALASIDGGANFAAVPLMRTVAKAGGGEEKQPVPVAEYRVLRWAIGTLPAGKLAQVRARVTVVDGVQPN